MTELSYVECTASNVSALAAVRRGYPDLLRAKIDRAIAKGEALLRARQRPEGSWEGVWGVASLYGTLFALRGLRATGAEASDPAVAAALEFLLRHQRADGSWGEHWKSALLTDDSAERYIDLGEGHPTQTAWAMQALLCFQGLAPKPSLVGKASSIHPNSPAQGSASQRGSRDPRVSDALERAARWLADAQLDSGDWPSPIMAGVFFRTALLDYRLYRRIFPVQALACYERWRAREAGLQRAPRERTDNRQTRLNP